MAKSEMHKSMVARFDTGEAMPAVVGSGMAVGKRTVSNLDVANFVGLGDKSRVVERLGTKVGIESRHWVEQGESVVSLATEALDMALDNAGVGSDELGSIYLATSTPDHQAVNTTAEMQYVMGMPNQMLGSVNMDACPGWVAALYRGMTELSSRFGADKRVAVIGAEVTSLFMSPRREDLSTTILFGDAAGAAVVQNVIPDIGVPGIIGFAFGLDGEYADKLGVMGSGSKNPTNEGLLANGLHPLYMEGQLVFEQAVRRLPQITNEALSAAEIPIEEIDWFLFHQANGMILDAVVDSLGIPRQRCIKTIQDMGNTSSASIPVGMHQAIQDGRIKRNDQVLVASIGGGLFYGGAVFPMAGLPKEP